MTHPDPDDIIELRSFGRRHGRKLSARQTGLLEHLLPTLTLNLDAPVPEALTSLYPPGAREVWLEIGFGGGEHLLWQAQHNPNVGLIGCEPFEEGVVKVLTGIEDNHLANIRLWPDDGRAVLRWLPPASIARAFVLFPDPWPKKKHQKRRLLSAATLTMIARVLKPGGTLRIGTDIPDYVRTIFMALAEVPQLHWTARSAADWRHRPSDWPQTRYEQKAHREGRTSCFLQFERGVAAPHFPTPRAPTGLPDTTPPPCPASRRPRPWRGHPGSRRCKEIMTGPAPNCGSQQRRSRTSPPPRDPGSRGRSTGKQ